MQSVRNNQPTRALIIFGGVHNYNNPMPELHQTQNHKLEKDFPENKNIDAVCTKSVKKASKVQKTSRNTQQNKSPTILLLPAKGKLELINKGKEDLYLYGTKFSNTQKIIENEPRTVPLEPLCYYFLIDKLEDNARQVIGLNGEALEPFEIYLTDSRNNKFIARFCLKIVAANGVITIHTQQLGVKREEW